MSHSPLLTAPLTLPVRWSRVARIALWGLQLVLAGLFLLAGGSKLAAAAPMVALFDAVGIGQWFRYVTGAIEVVSAVALERARSTRVSFSTACSRAAAGMSGFKRSSAARRSRTNTTSRSDARPSVPFGPNVSAL